MAKTAPKKLDMFGSLKQAQNKSLVTETHNAMQNKVTDEKSFKDDIKIDKTIESSINNIVENSKEIEKENMDSFSKDINIEKAPRVVNTANEEQKEYSSNKEEDIKVVSTEVKDEREIISRNIDDVDQLDISNEKKDIVTIKEDFKEEKEISKQEPSKGDFEILSEMSNEELIAFLAFVDDKIKNGEALNTKEVIALTSFRNKIPEGQIRAYRYSHAEYPAEKAIGDGIKIIKKAYQGVDGFHTFNPMIRLFEINNSYIEEVTAKEGIDASLYINKLIEEDRKAKENRI